MKRRYWIALLALLLVRCVYLVCLRLGSEYHVYYERFRDRITLRRADREAMFASLAADYSARLMHYCQIAPLQWFNFYDFWAMPTRAGTDAAA